MTQVVESYVLAHEHSIYHREEIERSTKCGCFYCLAVFAPGDITRWIDDEKTAMCPNCDIDSVLGSASGYPIDPAFLMLMHKHWFETSVRLES